MLKIIDVIGNLFEITTSFLPPVVFYVAIPFVALMSLLKIVREVH